MTRTANTQINSLIYLSENNALPIVSVVAVKFAVTMSKWATRRRTRLALSQLSDAHLRDVGLTPTQADQEAARAFWQV